MRSTVSGIEKLYSLHIVPQKAQDRLKTTSIYLTDFHQLRSWALTVISGAGPLKQREILLLQMRSLEQKEC